jgi:hypothetical protein
MQLSFDNITGHLRRAQDFNIHLDQWFDTQNDLMCSLIAELNVICAKIVPHIRLQPPASSSSAAAARNSRTGDTATRPFRSSHSHETGGANGYPNPQHTTIVPPIPASNVGGQGAAEDVVHGAGSASRGTRSLHNVPPGYYPQQPFSNFEQLPPPPPPPPSNLTPPPQLRNPSGQPQHPQPYSHPIPAATTTQHPVAVFHQQPQQQQQQSNVQRITFQNLLDRLSNGLHLGPTDLENALLILTPQGMQKLNLNIFVSIIPTLSIWVRQLQRTFHAFSLLHEGFCHFPGATQRQFFTQVSAVYAAVKDVLSDPSLLVVLSKHGVGKDRVQEFAEYLKHAIDAEVG